MKKIVGVILLIVASLLVACNVNVNNVNNNNDSNEKKTSEATNFSDDYITVSRSAGDYENISITFNQECDVTQTNYSSGNETISSNHYTAGTTVNYKFTIQVEVVSAIF